MNYEMMAGEAPVAAITREPMDLTIDDAHKSYKKLINWVRRECKSALLNSKYKVLGPISDTVEFELPNGLILKIIIREDYTMFRLRNRDPDMSSVVASLKPGGLNRFRLWWYGKRAIELHSTALDEREKIKSTEHLKQLIGAPNE